MIRFIIIFSLMALVACKEEQIFSVEYYAENEDARSEMIGACELKDDADASANCQNAFDAEQLARSRDLQDFFMQGLENQNASPSE